MRRASSIPGRPGWRWLGRKGGWSEPAADARDEIADIPVERTRLLLDCPGRLQDQPGGLSGDAGLVTDGADIRATVHFPGSAYPPAIVDSTGEVDAWPNGLFSEDFEEVMAIRRAQQKAEEKNK